GKASRSPGVTSLGSKPTGCNPWACCDPLAWGTGITNRCCRLSSTYESQCRKKSRVKTFALTGFFSTSSLRFLFSSLLSAQGFSEWWGYTADTNATDLPSGDQMPLFASVAMVVSCRASPPPVSMSQSWLSPDRFDSKRICLPSGLQRGWRSFLLATVVSSRGGVWPSVAASQRWACVWFLSLSVTVVMA